METLTYKCPSCGAPLIYQGDLEVLKCNNCGNSFEGETVRKVAEMDHDDAQTPEAQWDMQDKAFTQDEAARTKTYLLFVLRRTVDDRRQYCCHQLCLLRQPIHHTGAVHTRHKA